MAYCIICRQQIKDKESYLTRIKKEIADTLLKIVQISNSLRIHF